MKSPLDPAAAEQIARRKQGASTLYRIADPAVLELCDRSRAGAGYGPRELPGETLAAFFTTVTCFRQEWAREGVQQLQRGELIER